MGFELELRPYDSGTDATDADERLEAVMRRWARADERLRLAQATCRALRGHVAADDMRLIAAQLNLAQARHRRHELDVELARLRLELQNPED